MPLATRRLQREFRTIECMVEIHCRDHHGAAADAPCAECRRFLAYAERRLEKCPYGEDKPTCARCPVHCYKPAQREQARSIMRHAGPRMTLRHPWLSALHLADKLRRVEHPMAARRRSRS
jgi:Nitrous oxide-stimulated promoter